MPVIESLLEFRKCDSWEYDGSADWSGHGGTIASVLNSTTLIESGTNSIFDDVTNAQRQDLNIGTEYRKVFFKNNNNADFTSGKIWLSALGGGGTDSTPASNDTVKLLLGGTLSKMGVSVAVTTTTCQFVQGSAEVTTVSSLVGSVCPGEKIFNGGTGNDTAELVNAGTVLTVAADKITLTSAYAGTSSGAGGSMKVAPINNCVANFAKPLNKTDALDLGTTAASGGYTGFWLMREILSSGGDGYTANNFTVNVEMS